MENLEHLDLLIHLQEVYIGKKMSSDNYNLIYIVTSLTPTIRVWILIQMSEKNKRG